MSSNPGKTMQRKPIKIDYSEAIEMVDEETFKAVCYILSVKGRFYSNKGNGELTERFCEAYRFVNMEVAIAYRTCFDPTHQIDEATLIRLDILAQEV